MPPGVSATWATTAPTTETATPTATKTAKKSKKKPKTYIVKSGDTPSGIAEKHNLTLEQLLKLNPKLDPQTLSPGQKIRLSE